MGLKIGILGLGGIATKFARAIDYCDDIERYALASRDIEKSKAFAEKFPAEKIYGSYEELYNDPNVDAVYIATPHSFHKEQIINCLMSGKSVICEKPCVLTVKDAVEITELAKEKNLLLMEAMWTRFLPPVQKAKEWVENGKIGKVKIIEASFSYLCGENPKIRNFNPELAGGAVYDVGIYPFAFASFVAGSKVKEYKTFLAPAFTGVDEIHASIVKFENNALALISSGMRTTTHQTATIYGDNGKIVLPQFWATSKAYLYDNNGNLVDSFDSGYSHEDDAYMGFKYEAQHFSDLINSGKKESPIVPHEYLIECTKFFEDAIKDLK